MDFSVIKEKLTDWLEDNWDHKFLVFRDDPWAPILSGADPDGVVVTDFNPTAENMAQYLVEVVGMVQLLGTGCTLVKCVIEETRKCSCSYTKG